MSQLKITNAGIDYRNAVFAGEEVQNITHFIFANMPDQDASAPIDPNTTIPTDVLHSQPIKAVSKVDGNAVVISAVLGYDVGDFEYNWYGVVATKQNGDQVLIAVVTTELQTKTKTLGAVTGNYSVKSIVWRSQNIADDLNITLAVLPWQVQDEELVSKAVFDTHKHDEYLKKNDAGNYAHKLKENTFNNTQRIDTIGTALIVGGSGKQSGDDVSIYMGNEADAYGYYFTYVGSGNGNDNALEITTTNLGSPKKALRILQDGLFDISQLGATVAGHIIWHKGNMGTGSLLDADKVDGLQASQFLRSDISSTSTGRLKITNNVSFDELANLAPANTGQFKLQSGNNGLSLGLDSETNSRFAWVQVGHHTNNYPSKNIQGTFAINPLGGHVTINGYSAWHAGNMGAGSGLDADKLDGKDSTYFAKAEDLKTPVPANALFTDTNTWREVLDSLTSTAKDKSLSANQGRILKQLIDQMNVMLTSDDTTLDQIQEIVNYIKQNKETLDTLSTSNIAGLQEALDSKFDKSAVAYYAHKNKINTFSTTQQIDTTGTALIIGGSSKQGNEDVAVYFGNDMDVYGYYLTYVGSGNSNENAFEISSTNNGDPKKALRILQDGTFHISRPGATVAGNIIWHKGNVGAGSGLDADKLDGREATYFATAEDLKSLNESRKFSRSTTIENFRRHSFGEGNYLAPSVRTDGTALQDQDWFSVRATNGEPSIVIVNDSPTRFKRLLDGAIDTQVTIVADDKNERVFVYNKTDNMWEF